MGMFLFVRIYGVHTNMISVIHNLFLFNNHDNPQYCFYVGKRFPYTYSLCISI